MTAVAVLGLGAMGARMAGALVGAGHAVAVWNRSPEACGPLVEAGARAAATPRAAAEGAECVLAMVTDDDASRAVWLDPASGALDGMRVGAVAIESSTLTPTWVRALGAEAAARGVRFLDAPVVGSRPQAEARALAFLVGGEAAAVEAARPALAAMGQAIHPVGPVGAGATLKLVVNALFGVQTAALAELLAVAAASGLDRARVVEVLGELPVTSPAAKGVMGLMLAGRHAPLFPVDLVAKDFRYARAHAADVATEVPTTAAVHEVLERARAAGLGDQNLTALALLFARGA